MGQRVVFQGRAPFLSFFSLFTLDCDRQQSSVRLSAGLRGWPPWLLCTKPLMPEGESALSPLGFLLQPVPCCDTDGLP